MVRFCLLCGEFVVWFRELVGRASFAEMRIYACFGIRIPVSSANTISRRIHSNRDSASSAPRTTMSRVEQESTQCEPTSSFVCITEFSSISKVFTRSDQNQLCLIVLLKLQCALE